MRARWSLRTNIRITPSVCSAIETAWSPRPFVITTSLATRAGNSSEPTPAALIWNPAQLFRVAEVGRAHGPAEHDVGVWQQGIGVGLGGRRENRTLGNARRNSSTKPGGSVQAPSRWNSSTCRESMATIVPQATIEAKRSCVRDCARPTRSRSAAHGYLLGRGGAVQIAPSRIRTGILQEMARHVRAGGFDPPMRARFAKCSLRMQAALATLLTLLGTGSSLAGPWVLSPNEFHTDIRGSYYSTETFWDNNGQRPHFAGGGVFQSREVRWSTELGWRKGMSFAFDIPFESVAPQLDPNPEFSAPACRI